MAWIAVVPPSPRHPYERYQVCYREGTRQRSAGVFPTKRRAEAERRPIERGRTELTRPMGFDLEHPQRGRADIGAVQVEADALDQLGHVLLGQAVISKRRSTAAWTGRRSAWAPAGAPVWSRRWPTTPSAAVRLGRRALARGEQACWASPTSS
jgi:hypothetical protein